MRCIFTIFIPVSVERDGNFFLIVVCEFKVIKANEWLRRELFVPSGEGTDPALSWMLISFSNQNCYSVLLYLSKDYFVGVAAV